MQQLLIRSGVVLVLFGTLSGFAPMVVTNPRMGLAAHLGGAMNGLLLLALGAVWHHVRLVRGRERLTIGLLLWGAFGNWAVTLAASITGASQFAPLAGAGYGASLAVEILTLVVIGTVGLSMIAGLLLVIAGLRAAARGPGRTDPAGP